MFLSGTDSDEEKSALEEDLLWLLLGDAVVFLSEAEIDDDADVFFWVEDEDEAEEEEDVFF